MKSFLFFYIEGCSNNNNYQQTLSTTARLPVFKILRIIPPALFATATDEETRRIKKEEDAMFVSSCLRMFLVTQGVASLSPEKKTLFFFLSSNKSDKSDQAVVLVHS